jgi:4-amino-4-deoxy-L-arabinose transferase-like glycosyltransferase
LSSSRRAGLALAGIVALGAALRFATLGDQSLWLDEAFTHRIATNPLGDMLDLIRQGENTPPLYYALTWAWCQIAGTGEAALRVPSALAGTATIPVAYLIGRQVATRMAGLLLAGLVAASPFLVWYSQEARAYSLVVLLVSVSLLFALRLDDSPTRRNLVGWSAAATLAVATHYFATFVVLLEAAWLLWRPDARRAVLCGLAPVILAGLALVPLALDQRDNQGAQVGEASIPSRFGDLAQEFLVGKYGGPVRGLGPLCALLIVAGAAVALARAASETWRRWAVPLGIGAGTILVPLALAVIGVDYFATRYLAVAWVPLFAAFAAVLAARRLGVVAAAALAAVFVTVSIAVPLTPRLQRDDWRSAAAELGHARGARAIVVNPDVGFVPLAAYEPEVEAPPGPRFAVREIDVVVMTRDGRAPLAAAPVPGFRVLFTDRDPTYVLTRFVADRPRPVDAARLVAPQYTPDPNGLVYEPGP